MTPAYLVTGVRSQSTRAVEHNGNNYTQGQSRMPRKMQGTLWGQTRNPDPFSVIIGKYGISAHTACVHLARTRPIALVRSLA